MAISQMKRISLLFSKSSLDDVLKTIQELESVQFRDLKVQDNWSEALKKMKLYFQLFKFFILLIPIMGLLREMMP